MLEDSRLWKRTLGAAYDTQSETAAVELLRTAFLSMRRRIVPIVCRAHHDCYGLTIHDLTHLDALWEMADLIIGDDFPVNPVEAFVLGCSILLHDSALSISAYPGRLEELKKTAAWELARVSYLRDKVIPLADRKAYKMTREAESSIIFRTLRDTHASHAELMLEQEWHTPDGSTIRLMDDSDLRSFYGQSIGRIAHSHHCDIGRVALDLSPNKGGYPGFPVEWYLNERKVAAILRCSDAAHIDQRRASVMEYALIQPTGISNAHWLFQNRIGVPSINDGKLVYNSVRDFGRTDADAWWLCYDTCRMISKELESSSALMRDEIGFGFCVDSVEAVGSPKLFAKHVRPDGWVPVDAEIQVSDPLRA